MKLLETSSSSMPSRTARRPCASAPKRMALLMLAALCAILCTGTYAAALRMEKLASSKATFVYSSEVSKPAGKTQTTLQPLYGGRGPTHPIPAPAMLTLPADRSYVLPTGTKLTHATNVLFDTFRAGPTWFSEDPMEGLKMYIDAELKKMKVDLPKKLAEIKNVKEQNVVIQKRNALKPPTAFKEDLIPVPQLTEAEKAGYRNLFVREVITQRPLKLYVMSETEAKSLQHLVDFYKFPATGQYFTNREWEDYEQQLVVDSRTVQPPTPTRPWSWYSKPVKSFAAGNFTQAFCKRMSAKVHEISATGSIFRNFDGWRNPYDQDEIMLCDPTVLEKPVASSSAPVPAVKISKPYRKCEAATFKRLIDRTPAENPTGVTTPLQAGQSPYVITARSTPGATLEQFHYFILRREIWLESKRIRRNVNQPAQDRMPTRPLDTIARLAAMDQSHTLYDTLCKPVTPKF